MTCSLRGFPGVESPGRGGYVAPMLPGSDFGPNGGAVPCPATAGVRVVAPGLVSQVFVQAGVDYCDGGRIFVSAVQPGLRPEP